MKKIKVTEHLSEYGAYREAAADSGPMKEFSLQKLFDYAKSLSFELYDLDNAEIHGKSLRKPYQSPVVLLYDKENDTHAVISRHGDGLLKSFRAHPYKLED